ncbi:MAG: hypothetical protein JO366_10395 [Methylobacteriaceae bacterium]|nr:hypothetical protein [Methylobacteriaceae bacterium]MBV9637093.1 hypothetical protein [Methylobacteriaceae bacterium]
MRRGGKTVGCLIAVLGVLMGTAGGSEGPQQICYARTYDPAHLAQHPRQQVTEISLAVAARPSQNQDAALRFPFVLSAKIRGRQEVLSLGGECGFADADGMEVNMPAAATLLQPDAVIKCGLDNESGRITLQRRNKGAAALLKLEELQHLVLRGACGDGSCTYDLMSGPDDQTFLMSRTADAVCARRATGIK